MRRKLVAGNWKMNGFLASGSALAKDLGARASEQAPGCDVALCPPAHLLAPVGESLNGSVLALGGQTCHAEASGAHTGDLSAEMLADAGCRYVIVGHSERRQDHGEDDAAVMAKAQAARRAGLTPIVCVGETEAQRKAGQALEVIANQVRGSVPPEIGEHLVVAYEPVWAIGTGLTASVEDVKEAHAAIRELLRHVIGNAAAGAVRVLYGGSVKPDNAAELLATENVDGALVGGASLKAEDFWAIIQAA